MLRPITKETVLRSTPYTADRRGPSDLWSKYVVNLRNFLSLLCIRAESLTFFNVEIRDEALLDRERLGH